MLGKLMKCIVGVAAMAALFACVPAADASFGITVSGSVVDQAGHPDTQAGGHPFAVTTKIVLNTREGPEHNAIPDDELKDLSVDLPPGLLGNPNAVPKCEEFSFFVQCPAGAQVGVATVNLPFPFTAPVYNMQPPPGVVARFAFNVLSAAVVVDARLRPVSGGYGVSVDIHNISQTFPVYATSLTLWGVPADPAHDAERQGLGGGDGLPLKPFLTSPEDCSTGPLITTVRADSWQHPGDFKTASFDTDASNGNAPIEVTGCNKLAFSPLIDVQPQSSAAGVPSGYAVTLRTQQDSSPFGLAAAPLKRSVVTLPAGVAVSPSAADGLSSCSSAQIDLGSTDDPSCPASSAIGAVEIHTPLLPQSLEGSVYLAAQGDNPFGSLLAIYVVAEGQGVMLKIPGRIGLDPATGQLQTVIDDAPQLPFEDFRLSFFGGPRAALVNPASCGTYTADASFSSWSAVDPDHPTAGETAQPSSSFAIDSGCSGGFSPRFSAGTTGNQAGGFSPFSLTLSRADGDQPLGGVSVQMPPGLLGVLKSVPLCGEPQASAGTCGQESLIGHTTVGAGAGSNPFYLGGQVFLTGPYKGAPFGLSIVVPAVAGPFDLGTVVVRASIAVDPHTAQLSMVSDPLPSILQGIPLDLRVVNVTVDRTGFTFNPTDCEALAVGGTIMSSQGASAAVSSPFQAANCAALAFKPSFSASSSAKTSRAGGAALDVKVAYPAGAQANIHSVAVILPKQLPARLSTIRQACPAATFEVNPASCSEGSLVGTATASTPILSTPLTGPAYLVSHGGESFPDIVLVLQAQGIRIDLVGHVLIGKTGITSATFAHVPDAPISAFDLSLPTGPHSALAAVGSQCADALAMPTTITGQNGAQIKQSTKIKVAGCLKAKKKAKHRKHKKRVRVKKGSGSNAR